MDLDLDGRVAVVTGASKGIGLAVTRTLMQEGASVVASSRSRTPELDALDGSLRPRRRRRRAARRSPRW
jgi:NAD(P)-dependent dehydrogenase (short-subunit alcohol dehydrogenase family)